MNREVFKKAADYLREKGWRNDGEYSDNLGDPDKLVTGPCCLVGACAAVMGVVPAEFEVTSEYKAVEAAVRTASGCSTTYVNVTGWNDEQKDPAPVIALLEALAEVPA